MSREVRARNVGESGTASLRVRGLPSTRMVNFFGRSGEIDTFNTERIELARSDRPPLVFLHEGLGSLSMWRDFPRRLCDAAQCRALADFRGRPVIVNFWASWCPPCQAETPTIRDTAEAYAPQGLEVIGISVQEATEDDVRAYAEKYELGYTVAADLAGDVFRLYRVYGLPTQYFLDGDGIIRSIVQGPVTPESAASKRK